MLGWLFTFCSYVLGSEESDVPGIESPTLEVSAGPSGNAASTEPAAKGEATRDLEPAEDDRSAGLAVLGINTTGNAV